MLPKTLLVILLATGLLLMPTDPSSTLPWSSGAAWADDDGGDDGGDGGDGGDDGGSPGGAPSSDGGGGPDRVRSRGGGPTLGDFLDRLFQRPQRQQARTAPSPPPPPPPPQEFAADEIVALALSEDDLAILTAQGFDVLEEVTVPGVSATPRRLSIPPGTPLAEARATVRALPTGEDADFNHYYRSEQGFSDDCRGSDCPARLMIGWPLPASRSDTCGSSVTLGMVDTGINEDHETFDGASLDLRRIGPETFDRSRAIHGTAVAALLVGHPDTRSPGLVPGARLLAVDAFHRSGSDERADLFTLIQALGFLAEEDVQVLNLSLAGPENTVLEETVARLVANRDIVIVSAVGNGGPRSDRAYPAAYDPVIAVTAVDRAGNVYRRAVRGPHVDLAAPGVNIWTAASISGARWKTGTSFAVPFVTAAAAMLREMRPELSALEVREALREMARDLGDPGPDDVFGAGLLSIDGLCDDPA